MKNEILRQAHEVRKSEYEIHPLILGRWSPRAMSGEEISNQELMRLFEAARWAPSSYNSQPWRFIYAKRGTDHFDRLFSLMVEFNQQWTKNAAVLIVVISHKNFEHNGKSNRTASFTSGAAIQNLALQAAEQGLVAHGMEGFDSKKARTDLGVPDDYEVEAMYAVGRLGKKENLSEETQAREQPSDRRPLSEIIMEGKFRP